MSPSSLFRSPSDLLIHDHFHLKDLFVDYERLLPGERDRKTEVIRQLEKELGLHFQIEERLLYPSLLAVKSRVVEELVRTARSEHAAILEACRDLLRTDGERLQEQMMKALFKRVVLYIDFEEKRLLPWAKSLPGITLREMSLEIEEMKGSPGLPR